MEQHPVPQDITGFQFKLVGDMTLKQFGYLAAGCVFAFVFYSSAWYLVFRLLLAVFSLSSGVALAFIPIEERPLDTWIINFIKSVYKPTQYIWRKSATTSLSSASSVSADSQPETPRPQPENFTPDTKLDTYLASLPNNPPEPMPPLTETPETMLTPTDLPMTTSVPLHTLDDLIKDRELRQKNAPEIPTPAETPNANSSPASVEEKTMTIEELLRIRQAQEPSKLAGLPKRTFTRPANVRVIINKEVKPQPSLLQMNAPNTICGQIHDIAGAVIPNAIVIIKNTQGVSVRALRSNKVGQFLASTPLESGTYYLELEKEGYAFDPLEITLDGTILNPLNIQSKS